MMPTDLPLFAVPPMVRTTDPQSSRDAAARVAERLSSLQSRVLAAVVAAGARGLTGREIETQAAFADCRASSVRKRLSEAHHAGMLQANGTRDRMTVYVATGGAN